MFLAAPYLIGGGYFRPKLLLQTFEGELPGRVEEIGAHVQGRDT
jgi:hypothetical protein